MARLALLLGSFLAAALLFAAAQNVVAFKAEETEGDPKEERVDRLMASFDRDDVPGVAVVVVRDGDVVFEREYGAANLEYGIPITSETVFHIASVSKQFSAYAMVLLAQEGKLSLDDDIRTYIPEFPDLGESITIRHLIHHTSGLRDQWTLWAMAGGRMDDVITQENLLSLILNQSELNFSPGAAHVYSNSGYTLLAEIVERVTGEAFRDWMRAEIFEPLGMKDTQVYDDHEQIVENRAYSYRYAGDGTFRKAVLSYANAGATSLFTTGVDLARWLENFRDGTVGGLDAVEQMKERGVLTNGDTLRYAFGLIVDDHGGLERIQHGGADAGYRAFVSYYPEIDGGVIMLSNVGSFSQQLADLVAEIYFEDAMTASRAREHSAGAFHPRMFETFEGRYQSNRSGTVITYFRAADRYFEQVGNEPMKEIFPESSRSFTYFGGEPAVTFQRGGEGRVGGAILHGGDSLRRVPPERPSGEDLQAYAGTYYSSELESFYTLVVEDDLLLAAHRRHPVIRLIPKDKDLFDADAWFFRDVRFERDESGRVEAMLVSSDRVHHMRFQRL